MEKRIFQEHFLEWTFILDWELSLRIFIVALLMNDGVDDVEEHFFVWPNRIGTQGTTQPTNDFEHGITSMMNISTKIKKALQKARATLFCFSICINRE
jgi:hypothetical protein